MDLIFGQDEAVGRWVVERLPNIRSVDQLRPFTTIGVADGPTPIAGVVYNFFQAGEHGNSVAMTMAADSPRWVSHGTIRALLTYPFVQLHCVRVTVFIGRKNKRSRRLVAGDGKRKGIGFVPEGKLRRGFDGKQDLMVYGLLRDEAERWLRDEQGFRRAVAA